MVTPVGGLLFLGSIASGSGTKPLPPSSRVTQPLWASGLALLSIMP